MIVAGDDISSPVIAYSRNGNFPVEERPVNLDLWMKHYRIELNKARELNATSEVEILDTWDNITVLAKRQTAEENDCWRLPCGIKPNLSTINVLPSVVQRP